MKREKSLWNGLAFLIGATVTIMALSHGKPQAVFLIILLVPWSIWAMSFLLPPYISTLRRRHIHRQHLKKHRREGISTTELFRITDMGSASVGQILLRHVNHRISACLRASYPDVTWEWCEKSPERIIIQGGVGRIRVFGVPDFDHADIQIDQQANIRCSMIKTVSLSDNEEQKQENKMPPNKQPIDPQIWYEVQGRKVLETLVADLNSHGHSHLLLHEDGTVSVTEDQNEVPREHLANFPAKTYWDRLVQVFEMNGLSAAITAAGIQVSW